MQSTLQNRLNDVALLMLRGILAVVFMYHGSQKLFGWFGGKGLADTATGMESIGIPLPIVGTILAASAEFFGGIVLLLGVGTRIAAVPMAFTMLVAIVAVHNKSFSGRGGMEFALTLCVMLVALILTGPGRLTVARLIPRRSKQSVMAANLQASM
jgi:putative oxidoreductase